MVFMSSDNLASVQGYDFWSTRPVEDSKRDWGEQSPDWLEGYWASQEHPHRQLILDALEKLKPFHSLLEIGCNIGPNLHRIQGTFPNIHLAGIDASPNAVERAAKRIKGVDFVAGNLEELPFHDKSFDVILSDAVLMYTSPAKIIPVINHLNRVAKKAIVLVEWYDESEMGVIKDYHWARNYPKLFKDLGFEVKERKISSEDWPTEKWHTNGYMYVVTRV